MVFILSTIAFAIYLARIGAPLKRALPHGILDLELPWSTERAEKVIKALGAEGVRIAKLQTKLDFIFLLLYPIALSLSAALLAGGLSGWAAVIGLIITWGVLFAGPLDALENISMLRMLSNDIAAPWPQLSTICAICKFAVIFGGIVYLVVGGAMRLM